MNFWRYLRTVNRKKWITISIVVVTMIVAVVGLYYYPQYPKRKYITGITLMVTQPGYEVIQLYSEQRPRLFSINEKEVQVSNVAKMVTNKVVIKRTAARLSEKIPAAKINDMVSAYPLKAEKQGVELLTDLVEVRVEGRTPKEAKEVANTLVKEFKDFYEELTKKQIVFEKKAIEESLKKTNVKLEEIQNSIKEFKEENDIDDIDQRKKLLVDRLFLLQTQIGDLEKENKTFLSEKEAIKKLIKDQEKEIAKLHGSDSEYSKLIKEKNIAEDNYTNLQKRIDELKTAEFDKQKISEEKTFLEKETQAAKDKFIQTQDAVKNYLVKNNIDDITQRIGLSVENLFSLQSELNENRELEKPEYYTQGDALRKLINNQQNEISQLHINEAEFIKLNEEKKIAEESYLSMAKKLNDLRTEEFNKQKLLDERSLLEKKIQAYKDKFEQAQDAIEDYLVKNNVDDISQRKNLMVSRLFSLQSELADNERKKSTSNSEINAINELIDDIKSEINQLNNNKTKLSRLEDKERALRESNLNLISRMEEAKVREDTKSGTNQITVIDWADMPQLPEGYYKISFSWLKWIPAFDYKKLLILLIAFILASGAGIYLPIILEVFDNSIKSPEDVERFLGLPVQGIIPETDSSQGVLTDASSAYAESYNILQSNLMPELLKNKAKTIMIASAKTNEGRSTISANLGFVLANMGMKVYLVDADLRNPSLQRMFKVGAREGTLADLKDESFEKIVLDTGVENLKLVPLGSDSVNIGQLLTSEKIKKLFTYLREKSDFILIDVPPVSAFADACITAKYADDVLFIVRAGEIEREVYNYSISRLQKTNSNILGAVLVGAKIEHCESFYHYYLHSHMKSIKKTV
ncbi:MAG: polysaccharide biosynthesis tyrosine autokinase [Actinobacteria bacterium]|nr:polysaccharide biosynthesis tyrosine autokinase [Actinomycetota bacterium]